MKIRISFQPTIAIRPKASLKAIVIGVLMIASPVLYFLWVLVNYHELDATMNAATERTLSLGREIRSVSVEADKVSAALSGKAASLSSFHAFEVLGRDLSFRWGRLFRDVEECLVQGVTLKSMDCRISSGTAELTITAACETFRMLIDSARRFHDSGEFDGVFLKSHGFGQGQLKPSRDTAVSFALTAKKSKDSGNPADKTVGGDTRGEEVFR